MFLLLYYYSNALYFRLQVVKENRVRVTFVGVDGFAAGFFFPSTLRELKRSFLFIGSLDDCTATATALGKEIEESIVGEYSRLCVYTFGKSLSLSVGRFIAGIIVFLWTQFALSEAVFEVISVVGILLTALLTDIERARDRVLGSESPTSTSGSGSGSIIPVHEPTSTLTTTTVPSHEMNESVDCIIDDDDLSFGIVGNS